MSPRRWLTLCLTLMVAGLAVVLAGAALAQSPAPPISPQPAERTLEGWTPSSEPVARIESIDAQGTVTITTEGFEGVFPGAGWDVTDGEWGASACQAHTGSKSAWVEGQTPPACGSNYSDNFDNLEWMVYGPFDLSGATSASLRFSYWLNSESCCDFLFWGSAITSTFYGYESSGNSNGWVNETLDLSNYAGQASVYIAFVWDSDLSINMPEGAFVDDVVLTKTVNLPAPNLVPQKSADRAVANAGQSVTYTISVLNNGALNATGARLTDTLPISMSLVGGSLTANGGAFGASGRTITWTGAINVNQTARITYSVALTSAIPNGAVLTNPITITDGAGGTYTAQETLSVGAWLVNLPSILRVYCSTSSITDYYYTIGYLDDMTQINADDAWLQCVQGDPSITVAVIDTGVDLDHPDLAANLIPGYDYVDNDATPEDGQGHGSNVAGIVGAALNGTGVVGVAPRTHILPVRVLDNNGSGYLSDVASGVYYAADRAQILNLSLGSVSNDSTLSAAINYAAATKGRLVVAAAGNCGDSNYYLNGCSFQDQTFYPAAYSNAFAVAAVDGSNNQASFSTQGSYVDIAAPGVDIYSAFKNNSYLSESGTSQASPHVAGLAALIWARFPSYTAAQVRSAIESNATDVGTAGWDIQTGHGVINVLPSVGLTGAALRNPPLALQAEPLPAPIDRRDAAIAPGRVLIRFKPAVSAASASTTLNALGVSVAGEVGGLDIYILSVPVGQEWALIDQLRASPDVEFVEPDYVIHLLP